MVAILWSDEAILWHAILWSDKKENREVDFSVFVKIGEFLLESIFYGDLSHQDLPIYVEKIWLNAHFSKMFKISFFTNRLNFDTISCRLV